MQRIHLLLLNLKTTDYIRIIGFILLSVLVCANVNWTGIEEADTVSYLDVATKWFASDNIHFRPAGYPLLMLLSITLFNNYTFVVVVQVLAYLFSFIIVCWWINPRISNSSIHLIILQVVTFIAFANPQSIAAVSVILPEILSILPLTIMLYVLLTPVRYQTITLVLSGFLLLMLKPIWIILFPALIGIVVLLFFAKQRTTLKPIITAISGIFILFSAYQIIISKSSIKQNFAASTKDVNLNLAMIRYGLIDGAEQSNLYQFVTTHNLYSSIKDRQWNNSEYESSQFTTIKNSIPWNYREDPTYWKHIIKNNPKTFSFIGFQFNRIINFFTTSASNKNVQFTNFNTVKYIYQGFYSRIHKTIIPILYILLLGICIWTLFNPNYLHPYQLFLVYTLFLFAIATTVFTYQDSSFLRLRSGLEPFVFLCPLYCIYFDSKLLRLLQHKSAILKHQ